MRRDVVQHSFFEGLHIFIAEQTVRWPPAHDVKNSGVASTESRPPVDEPERTRRCVDDRPAIEALRRAAARSGRQRHEDAGG